MGADARPPSQQGHKGVARRNRIAVRAGMTWRTSSIHFAGGDTGNAKARSFRAPNWSISIPDMGRRAIKRLTCGHHCDLSS